MIFRNAPLAVILNNFQFLSYLYTHACIYKNKMNVIKAS